MTFRMISPPEDSTNRPDTQLYVFSLIYYDTNIDDARLTIEVLKEAIIRGADSINYCKVFGYIKDNGKIVGIKCKDLEKKSTLEYSLIYVSLLLLGFGLIYIIKRTEISAHYYISKKTREIIEKRMDRMFDLREPETVFIVVVPRKNWRKTMIEDAEDAGFLKIDNNQLLFEGGTERWILNKHQVIFSLT